MEIKNMAKTSSFRNINIKVPTELLNKIKIVAIQRNQFAKDVIIECLKKGVKNAVSSDKYGISISQD